VGRSGLRAAWLFPALVGLLGGCAGVHEVTGTASQDDLLQLRGEVVAAQQAAQRARTEAEAAATRAVDARMRSQNAEGDQKIEALNRRLDGLTTSLTDLTTRVDDLASRLEALARQQRGAAPVAPRTAAPSTDTSSTITTPSAAPSTTGPSTARPSTAGPATAGPATASPPTASPSTAGPSTASPSTGSSSAGGSSASGPTTASVTPGARPSTNALQPQDIYQAAYIDFSKGSYALAMAGFAEFIRRFPDHPLAGNAQYWIGESHYSIARGYANSGQNDKVAPEMELAVQEFRKVIANYPRGEKAPTALYKEALALLELKQPAVAQQRLEYLVANFPQSEETPLARERLAALKTQ